MSQLVPDGEALAFRATPFREKDRTGSLEDDHDKRGFKRCNVHLFDLDFELEVTEFNLPGIDFALDSASEASPEDSNAPEDAVPEAVGPAVSSAGDLSLLGRHRLQCGNTRDPEAMAKLMEGKRADLFFTDPPYNVAINGNVCGLVS